MARGEHAPTDGGRARRRPRLPMRAAVAVALVSLGLLAVPRTAVPVQAAAQPSCVASGYFCPLLASDVLDWSPAQANPRQRASVALAPRAEPAEPYPGLVLGLDFTDFNYRPDADGATQGGSAGNFYAFDHWQDVDVAYYFQHSLVNVPPVVWTNAAHRNGVPMLGAVGSDFTVGGRPGSGGEQFNALFDEPGRAVAQLTALARTYGFDGWLIDPEPQEGTVTDGQVVQVIRGLRANHVMAGFYQAQLYALDGQDDPPNDLSWSAANAADFWQSDYTQAGDAGAPGYPTETYEALTTQSPRGLPYQRAYTSSYVYNFNRLPGGDVRTPPCPDASWVDNGLECLHLGSPQDGSSLLGNLAYTKASTSPPGFWTALGVFAPGWPAYAGSPGGFPIKTPASTWQPVDDRIWDGERSPTGASGCSTAESGGISQFLTPRSVLSRLPFTTSFNEGFGGALSVQGGRVPTSGWDHMSTQDVLPAYVCPLAGAGTATLALRQGSAWFGNSSLELGGHLPGGASAGWNLWPARLPVDPTTVAQVRVRGSLPGLALHVETPGGSTDLPFTFGPPDANGWRTGRASFAGGPTGRLTAVGLTVGAPPGAAVPLAASIGQLSIAAAAQYARPTATRLGPPAGHVLELPPADGAIRTDVYARTTAGCRYLGPAYAGTYDVIRPLVPLPPGETATGYVAVPVSGAGQAADLPASLCAAAPPLPGWPNTGGRDWG